MCFDVDFLFSFLNFKNRFIKKLGLGLQFFDSSFIDLPCQRWILMPILITSSVHATSKKGIIFKCLQREEHRKSHAGEKNGFLMSNIEEKEMVVDLSMEEKGKFGNLVFKIIEF